MKTSLIPALKLTFLFVVILTILYPAILWGVAKLSPDGGKGERISYKGNSYYTNIGQSFTDARYFWSRPSAVGYHADGSGASNMGPSNVEYLDLVQERIDSLLVEHPELTAADIPMDLITASGSGLDPDISVQAATIQVKRIAKVRHLPAGSVAALVKENTQKPLFGIFGPEKINVLKLNIALDKLDDQEMK